MIFPALKICSRKIQNNFVVSGLRHASDSASVQIIPLNTLLLKVLSLNLEENADSLFHHIKDIILKSDAPVMEFRAGEGFLSQKLLEAGVRNIHVYEKRSKYIRALKQKLSHYPGRAYFHQRTINQVFFEGESLPLYHHDTLHANLPFKCLKSWDDSPSFRMISGHKNGKVLIIGLLHLSKNMMYHGMGRPQMILVIPSSSWKKLNPHHNRSSYHEFQPSGFLFPDFFEVEEMGAIPLPIRYSCGSQLDVKADEEFLTVSISPRRDWVKILTPEILEEYGFFGTQILNGKAKHKYIIPTLENWLPGCGKVLIANGINCFSRFLDLTATEAFQLYNAFKSVPNFHSSLFMLEYQNYIQQFRR